jgi:predicted nucleic acid-binding protein
MICCDANLVVRTVTGASGTIIAELWRRWHDNAYHIVAPTLIRFEIANALHRLHRVGELSATDCTDALRAALAFPIELHADDDLHVRAVELAAAHNLAAAYDAHYLALAERLGIDCWTADERLYNSVRHRLSWVHFVSSTT